jgi:flagellar basal-body rod modification protein FlgD
VLRVVELGAQGAGEHTFEFDGKTDTGATMPDGTYALEIVASAAGSKTPTPLDLSAKATIDGVDLSSDPPALLVGSLRIGMDQIREVHTAGSRP